MKGKVQIMKFRSFLDFELQQNVKLKFNFFFIPLMELNSSV